jgi:hypothetical protein
MISEGARRPFVSERRVLLLYRSPARTSVRRPLGTTGALGDLHAVPMLLPMLNESLNDPDRKECAAISGERFGSCDGGCTETRIPAHPWRCTVIMLDAAQL